jgi:hypothetical protein
MSWINYLACEACHYSNITILKDKKTYCSQLLREVTMQAHHCEYAERLVKGCMANKCYMELELKERVFIVFFTNHIDLLTEAQKVETNGYVRKMIDRKIMELTDAS